MKSAIFIDGGYLEKVIKNEFPGTRIDFSKIPHALCNGKEVLRTYYYNCLPYQSNPPSTDEKNRLSKAQAFHYALDSLPRFQVKKGRLQKKGAGIFVQKGVDTLLSVDLVHLALTRQISDAILIAGDYDFNPAVEVAKTSGINIILVHSQDPKCYHRELWNICDERIPLNQTLVDSIKR